MRSDGAGSAGSAGAGGASEPAAGASVVCWGAAVVDVVAGELLDDFLELLVEAVFDEVDFGAAGALGAVGGAAFGVAVVGELFGAD